MKRINWMQVIGITGTVLGLAGTLLSNISQKNVMNESIKKEVERVLAKKNGN